MEQEQLMISVNEMLNGKDTVSNYNELNDENKLEYCNLACEQVAKDLDTKVEDAPMPDSVQYVSLFLTNVSRENAISSVKHKLTVYRIVKFNLDTDPNFEKLITHLNKTE